MRMIAIIAAAVCLAFAPSARGQALPEESPLTPAQLAELRGGFQLPGGLAITIGVTTATRIDGREVLRSTFNIRDGLPQVGVLANDAAGKLASVTATADGAAVTTADGVVRLRSAGDGVRVDLAGDAIQVSHLLGSALGSIVANSGNDRSIDVTTSVDIGLSGITPDAIGGSAIRAENLALDATARMVR